MKLPPVIRTLQFPPLRPFATRPPQWSCLSFQPPAMRHVLACLLLALYVALMGWAGVATLNYFNP